ncbi:MAG: phosphate transport system regulatory protein PhoU [Alphaproteobacteria bacterium]|nr:MAG: phosphate transport system regulatory protein PhoU [Alphaproteobacteria bacterium]
MPAGSEHIVKSFDDELKQLNQVIAQMGGLAEAQLQMAIDALARRDTATAQEAVASDARINQLETQVDAMAVRMLALRQPMAQDLREVVAALKISGAIERIGDYAANVAKRVLTLSQLPPVRPLHAIPRMGRLTQELLKEVLDAYIEHDAEKAVRVWERDEEVDEMYTSLFRELLTYMMEDPRNITPCTHLLFIAKNIERIGDHATNIAETIHFLVRGKPLEAVRPKGDKSSFAVVTPGAGGEGGKDS